MNTTAFTLVCNGALTIEQCIRHHIPSFDRYVVVEGAALPGHDNARGDGRRLTGGKPNSTDGTVEILERLKEEFDNLIVIYAKDCWNGKTAMCNAALEHALPGILWELDADEFYTRGDMNRVKFYLEHHPDITDVEFWGINFWGDTDHHSEMSNGCWGNNPPWRRVFRYQKGDTWASHEPPRLKRKAKVLSRDGTKQLPAMMYHYGYVHRSQLEGREAFYNCKGALVPEFEEWQKTKPLTYSSGRLVQFNGKHPIDVSFLKESYAQQT